MNPWLYRKNNNEQPCCWRADLNDAKTNITVCYGIVGKTLREETYIVTQKDADKEVLSRYNEKRKQGYLSLTDIKDDHCPSPVEETTVNLVAYLTNYLPSFRNNENNGNLLPMLAKTYKGSIWKKTSLAYGQWKINGLRCFITAYKGDTIFNPIRLRFQSREGIIWDNLTALEDYLFDSLSADIIISMLEEGWALDGEIYLPGYSVNEINHFVKDPKDKHHDLLQFWCYDIAIPNMSQIERDKIRINIATPAKFANKNEHLINNKKLIILPSYDIVNDEQATNARNNFIDLGFEGLILRNPNVEYQYGRRRVAYMEKYKDKTDGKFKVIDIQREQKRNLPILVCQNDINEATFETRLSASHSVQEEVLLNKNDYIGKYIFVAYGERSGVNNVPFHIKEVYFI